MNSEKDHTNPVDKSQLAPKSVFSSLACAKGPTINVVPESAIAAADVLTTFVPTLTLFKLNNQREMKNFTH
jgi:hypothetical protein